MKPFFSSLLLLCLTVIAGTTAYAQDETRAVATWKVQKYDISATIPQGVNDRSMSVRAKLDLRNRSSRPASTLTLRISTGAEISSVSINGSTADFSKSEEKVGTGTLQRIVMRMPPVAPNATISAAVDYKLGVKENSGLASISPVASQFLPLSFWYPTPNSWYFPSGADWAPKRLVVNAPGGMSAVSSGVQNGGSFDDALNSQPFFAAGNWSKVTSGGVSLFLPAGLQAEGQKRGAELATLMTEAVTFTSSLLGAIPQPPLRIVAVSRGAGFSGGGTVLVDEGVFRQRTIDSQTAMTVAEAVAKVWLGNAVAIDGDGGGVVREGLSRYIATLFIESKYGKEVADLERLRQRTAFAAIAQRVAPLSTLSPLDDYYYSSVSNKGSMIWRLLARKSGDKAFFDAVRAGMKDGLLTTAELRSAFPDHKEFLDHIFDDPASLNLMVGLPQFTGGESRIALRNTGGVDATVNILAVTASGERLTAQSTIRARSFGEVAFRSPNKLVRVEIDTDKIYPQTDYFDDVSPREFSESDLLLAVKREFDRQNFSAAEKNARIILRDVPRFDEVRVLLGRSLLALGRNADAEREFKLVLDEKLPMSRSLAWANVGLAEIYSKTGNTAQAIRHVEEAIGSGSDYGAGLAARAVRTRLNASAPIDDAIKSYFTQFDRAAASNRKADLDALVVPGEASKFASGISGSTEQWQTEVRHVDKLDDLTVLAETSLSIKLLNKDVESGTAVYRLSKVGGSWKLSSVDIFEVR